MSTHNQFAPEVSDMRTRIGDYGGPAKFRNAVASPDSYKAQALRELASRLYLEDYVEELNKRIGALVDRVETLEMEADLAGRVDISRSTE